MIGVFRHGDRTPKQKMKMIVKDSEFFGLFTDLGGYRKGTLKLKKPKELQVGMLCGIVTWPVHCYLAGIVLSY